MPSEALSRLQRVLDEVDALSATYPEQGAVRFSAVEEIHIAHARQAVASSDATQAIAVPDISGEVRLLDCAPQGQPVGMQFALSGAYPVVQPSIKVICAADRQLHDALTAAAHACLEEHGGSEVLLLALEALGDAAEGFRLGAVPEAPSGEYDTVSAKSVTSIARKLIWSHHIKAPSKRKNIHAWAKDLRLRGFSKPGFPGIIVCEGESGDVQEFWERLRALRWQALSVRAEECEACNEGDEVLPFRFQPGFRELGEGDMDVLAAECRAAGLDHLFMAALKL